MMNAYATWQFICGGKKAQGLQECSDRPLRQTRGAIDMPTSQACAGRDILAVTKLICASMSSGLTSPPVPHARIAG